MFYSAIDSEFHGFFLLHAYDAVDCLTHSSTVIWFDEESQQNEWWLLTQCYTRCLTTVSSFHLLCPLSLSTPHTFRPSSSTCSWATLVGSGPWLGLPYVAGSAYKICL
ncbi:hypothetical protein O6P43_026284 [Quillaja saponaria]|uniref:Uncharacterized protein n=1 Tax=Quillaja saponaria TaxID=32244 RepID=A0AAD7L261_QUISA|nr:hypothetical protein O6P43_026284 [Quillaja saponaria]